MHYIWTNHARDRLRERHIPQHNIDQTINHPDRTQTKKSGSTEYSKRIDDRTYAVLLKPNDRGEQLIISLWVDPPFPGTRDAKKKARYQEMQNASWKKKIWLTILDQLGL